MAANDQEARKLEAMLHLQYQMDESKDMANLLIVEVRYLPCKNRRTKHQDAVATAQFNPWLAAQ